MQLPSTERAERDHAVLRFLAPRDEAGIDGTTVAAGHVLEWIDRAGFACAAGWSGSICATAYVGNVHFRRPIPVGSVVETGARIIATGRTSMQVLVTVDVADPRGGEPVRATSCLLVYVAIDDDGDPRPVPAWSPSSLAELDLTDRAEQRVRGRARIRSAMAAERYTGEGTAPRLLLRFLTAPGDGNGEGMVQGGTVMRWIDEAAQACAASWTKRRTVGVYAGGIQFDRPIPVGSLVEVESRVIHTSEHSVHVASHVRAADPMIGEYARIGGCISVFVVPGDDGRAEPVEPLPLVTDEDVRLDRHARDLIAMRAELDAIGESD
ncbi:acyl-CoA thioesterase [Amnibacterium sp. CER49]|uniref:acyl-CoA thioesterase n=1 Tax=Amnibacterium sp. CER49 TaxID=3039161 RepID=UPI002448C469|nr:acyl-CoA thioesterase [Amnibacterium sp. CER49]MDH2444829.1 acyl-CoA thioesterase [Amnibacterium sp. CER49]